MPLYATEAADWKQQRIVRQAVSPVNGFPSITQTSIHRSRAATEQVVYGSMIISEVSMLLDSSYVQPALFTPVTVDA